MPKPRLRNRQRTAFPGIYDDPRAIADRAELNVDPESPYLEDIFGVTRSDLALAARQPQGDPNWTFPGAAPNPKGSESAYNIMTPSNTQRLVDQLGEFRERAPRMTEGMEGWYIRDPMRELLGEFSNNPDADFDRYSALSAMASPGSDVYTELNRGSAALYHANSGLWDEFAALSKDRPIEGVMGHPYHSTAQVPAMAKYLNSGEIQSKEPKVPSYYAAGTGRQSNMAVGDAHWSRGVGLADVRRSKKYDASASGPEMQALAPWWADIAGEAGFQPVPGQAINWGGMALETGVESRVGVPKLELEANAAGTLAAMRGISPRQAMARIATGTDIAPTRSQIESHMKDVQGGFARPGALMTAGGVGALAMMANDDATAATPKLRDRRQEVMETNPDIGFMSTLSGYSDDTMRWLETEAMADAKDPDNRQAQRELKAYRSELNRRGIPHREQGFLDIGMAGLQAGAGTIAALANQVGGDIRSFVASVDPTLSDVESAEIEAEALGAGALYQPGSELGQGLMNKVYEGMGYMDPVPALQMVVPDEVQDEVGELYEQLPERNKQFIESGYNLLSPI